MAKKKTQNKKTQNEKPAPGRNRAEKRLNTRHPQSSSSGKPMWIRVVIVVILAVMFLGFFLLPLIR